MSGSLVVPIDISGNVTSDEPTTAAPESQAKAGFSTAFTSPVGGGSALNAHDFHIRQIISGRHHAALVVVKAVQAGGIGPVGMVSVQPLVNQQDGYGNQVSHDTIYNIPYCRLQGGTNAIVLDPVVGDIGVALFCDRDNSNVIATKKISPPGSWRQNSWSDGCYLGGYLNGTPTNYIAFTGSGITLSTSGTFTVQSSNVTIDSSGNVHANGNMNANGEVAAHSNSTAVHLSTHTHGGVQTGLGTTAAPTPGS